MYPSSDASCWSSSRLPVTNYLPEEWAYYAKDPKKYDWITGFDIKSHVTLLYGLLREGLRLERVC